MSCLVFFYLAVVEIYVLWTIFPSTVTHVTRCDHRETRQFLGVNPS